jgi:hypothetical protein
VEKDMAGYSPKPLVKKLGIKEGMCIHAFGAPKDYLKLIGPLPEGVKIDGRLTGNVDIVHLFTMGKAELAKMLKLYRDRLKPTAAIWVSWPKKASKIPTDITEDTIRASALPLGFVDVKVCAVTDVWSGLKLVVRKELR